MNWYVYLLLCDQKTFYVGISNNLSQRFRDHLNKQSFHTKQFSDLKFVYAEKYIDKYEVAKREKQLKGWSHSKKQILIDRNIDSHQCTEFVEVLLREDKKLVSLLRA